ncbi:hypothetical protein [Pedobacter sp.]|uniref:hypothetical protein n=1 Tax=Pedobacter sp. TaxID=1411316 RepID=UPI0031D4E064
MKILKIIALLFCFLVNKAIAQTNQISFQLTAHNNIAVKTIINKKDTAILMFHLAASSVTLTEEALRKIKSVRFERTDSVSSWGGSGNTSRFSSGNELQIGNFSWAKTPIWENKNSGPNTDGKFGLDLFKDKVVGINFEKSTITVNEELPKDIGQYQKLSIDYHDEMMFVSANCELGNSTVSNKFLIHSGYAGSILFDDQFSNTNKLSEQLKITSEKQLKDSYGNVLKTKKAILPNFILGRFNLKNISVGFFDGAIGRQKMSILGGDILKRFNLIIDAKRQFIYLKPNKLKNMDYLDI